MRSSKGINKQAFYKKVTHRFQTHLKFEAQKEQIYQKIKDTIQKTGKAPENLCRKLDRVLQVNRLAFWSFCNLEGAYIEKWGVPSILDELYRKHSKKFHY
jgi:hypothetical protein